MSFRDIFGHNEGRITGNISSPIEFLPAKQDHVYIIRRIRGTSVGDITLATNGVQVVNVITGATNFDFPGLELEFTNEVTVSSSTTDPVDINIQYATKRVQGPFNP